MNTICRTIIILMASAAFMMGRSEAQSVSWSGSGQFTTGSYFFEENTKSFYLVNGLQYTNGRLSLGASLPLVVQNSPWISYIVVSPTGSGL